MKVNNSFVGSLRFLDQNFKLTSDKAYLYMADIYINDKEVTRTH